jgi:hypothetical protein
MRHPIRARLAAPNRGRVTAALAAGLLLGLAPKVAAQPTLAEESAIKAAYIYNFGKFTDWPAEAWGATGRLRLCLAGPDNELARAIEALQGKTPVQGRTVEVASLSRPSEAGACHVLVLTSRDRVAQDWIGASSGAPVLTVGDTQGFSAAGGMVGLFVDGEKVRFEINLEAAQRARLKLSSQLLRLARLVKDGGQTP